MVYSIFSDSVCPCTFIALGCRVILYTFDRMAGIKRKESVGFTPQGSYIRKKPRMEEGLTKKSVKESFIAETATDSDPIVESDTTSQSGEDDGVSWPSDVAEGNEEWGGVDEDNEAGGVKVAAEAANIASNPAPLNGASTGTSGPGPPMIST